MEDRDLAGVDATRVQLAPSALDVARSVAPRDDPGWLVLGSPLGLVLLIVVGASCLTAGLRARRPAPGEGVRT